MKRPDGVAVIAIADFLMGGVMLIGACAILMTMMTIAVARGSVDGRFVAVGFVGIGLLATMALAGMGLAAGWGLWKLKEWGRWLTIVLAIFSLLGFPIGTIIGGLVIWYLLKPEVALAFGSGLPVVPPPPVAWNSAMPGSFATATPGGPGPSQAPFPPVAPPPDAPIPPAGSER